MLSLRNLGFIIEIEFDHAEGIVDGVDGGRHVDNEWGLQNVEIRG
jgi:hypothetical protein